MIFGVGLFNAAFCGMGASCSGVNRAYYIIYVIVGLATIVVGGLYAQGREAQDDETVGADEFDGYTGD